MLCACISCKVCCILTITVHSSLHVIIPLTQRGSTTPLYIASQQGHSDVVNTLIRNGARVNMAKKVSKTIRQNCTNYKQSEPSQLYNKADRYFPYYQQSNEYFWMSGSNPMHWLLLMWSRFYCAGTTIQLAKGLYTIPLVQAEHYSWWLCASIMLPLKQVSIIHPECAYVPCTNLENINDG